MDSRLPHPEKVVGFHALEMRPVRRLGSFERGIMGNRRLAGWAFDDGPEHVHKPSWSADLLYAIITTTLEGIKALPGPASW